MLTVTLQAHGQGLGHRSLICFELQVLLTLGLAARQDVFKVKWMFKLSELPQCASGLTAG